MNTQTFAEHRTQTRNLAHELLDKRAQLWTLREQLDRLLPCTEIQDLEPLVRRFCQDLIDYISLEHFGIFHHLASGCQEQARLAELAAAIYPCLSETTGVALDFNDKCEALAPDALRLELPGELAVLADGLSMRAELEDRLIDAIAE